VIQHNLDHSGQHHGFEAGRRPWQQVGVEKGRRVGMVKIRSTISVLGSLLNAHHHPPGDGNWQRLGV
jgi:hypothetical protein